MSQGLSFRAKLTLLLMMVVFSCTSLALYLTQRTELAAEQRNLEDQFQSRHAFLQGVKQAWETELAQRCRSMASIVRIQAALEEGDVEDLYANAAIDLRDVLQGSAPSAKASPTTPKATILRFITADGKVLEPPGLPGGPEPWESKIAAATVGATTQQIGYIATKTTDGREEIDEVVATPILGPDGEKTAMLLLGFPAIDLAMKSDSNLLTGIWLDDTLRIRGLPPSICDAISATIAKFIHGAPRSDNHFGINIDDEPYLLFFNALNPGSKFAPAHEISLYPRADSIARQQRTVWRIVGIALLVLAIGMMAAFFFSTQLSRPVEKLAEVSAQNLAGRQQAEADRELTEQKYRSIFENAVEGIFLLASDGRCLSANPAMARIFGYNTPAQLLAETADNPEKLYAEKKLWNDFMNRARSEGVVSNFECEAKRRDGTTIWISQNARAVKDAAGTVLNFEGTMEDITDRRKAADSLRLVNAELEKALAELKATQNQIIQQERLRALGQMASGIAHDFNNSLMPVMGFAELLLSSPAVLDDKKKATGYIETIRTAAKDASSIVGRLREFYRTNEHNDVFKPVDLVKLAKQAASLTQPKWKGQASAKGVDIKMREELVKVPPIAGDESALREVLTNLIFNAVDAMPKGGTITLRTHSANGQAFLEVADSGTGMTEEVRQRCLEPFFTTKGEGGTGLGLAMVFGIVQRHGGTIDLRSELGQGTTFSLGFPVSEEKVATMIAKTAHLPKLEKLRILMVDDEESVRDVLSAFLEHDGHSVRGAGDATQGLRCFSEEKFDLVITDKAIPGMSGDQMALEIKKIAPRTPVILLSGFNAGLEDEKMPGIDVVASKPIMFETLRKAIRQAMGSV